ncbi:FAD/NAD(P)-binding domain-containing protein [Delitschia confertaspora ATCC 74209]|uniref:FAD/NAD(P)-binding domain-containing protein n=1 Tax=Delitschia confertaspora ATCC 74209 TaxID=1513339 RepID=A0A9P4MN09_9PLEO|nr:FAD/NAD(P)-binding domain-containing protein [Delitschia confertaspora ATCC 74209]
MTTETILILGGSFAGLSAAHYALRHVLPSLPKKDGTTYTVTLVNPNKDFFWRIAGPRACVSTKLMPSSKYLFPIEPAFASYPKGTFNFIQGIATHVDPTTKSVSITGPTGEQPSTISYLALIIATGVSTPSPLFTHQVRAVDGEDLLSTFEAFQKLLPSVKTVVIGGAGPVGVETAGEIAEFLNGKPGFFASKPPHPKAKVILVCAEQKMLPLLRESISKQAEKYLKRLGVEVVYNTKVVSAVHDTVHSVSQTADNFTVHLSDGKTIAADIYVDATGTRPNTGFLPSEWLDSRNKVACDKQTLRVGDVGSLVYVVGDAGSYTRGGVMDMNDAVPTAMTNLKTDLIASVTGKAPGPNRIYKPNLKEQQICPIGTAKGVGAFAGYKMPSFVVWMIKGRDYMSGQMAPQILNGDAFKKEGKWKPDPVGAAQRKVGLSSN